MDIVEQYGAAPFSVLRADCGPWQARKRAWLAHDLSGDESRRGEVRTASNESGGLTFKALSAADPDFYRKKTAAEREAGRELTLAEFLERYEPPARLPWATSLFDPVLAEVAVRWFSPPGGLVLDPFAGGPVRGLVSSLLGRRYLGIDLREEQVEVDRRAAARVLPAGAPRPEWLAADALEALAPGGPAALAEADLVMTCPPYADLEVYSEDPRDLSRMAYPAFRDALARILALSCERLRPNSFAVVVLGEARDRRGGYYGLVPDAIVALREAGLTYLNEAILVGPTASHAMRVRRSFDSARRMPKTHQNVLVFCKGDPRRAAERIGPIAPLEVPKPRAEPAPAPEAAEAEVPEASDDGAELAPPAEATQAAGPVADSPVRVVRGDSLDVLRAIEDARFHAIITDPPYGLSEPLCGERAAEVLAAWIAEGDWRPSRGRKRPAKPGGDPDSATGRLSGGGFMGAEWDGFVPGPRLWAEALRTTRPGGYAFVFAGTRTVGWMQIALMLAGWRVVDVISWCYGEGFPKGGNVGKRVDEHLGHPRPPLGQGAARCEYLARGEECRCGERSPDGERSQSGGTKHSAATEPQTPEGERFDDWSSTLKPGHEPIIVAQRPLEAAIAPNLLKWAAGALNIGACRLPVDPSDPVNTAILTPRASAYRTEWAGFVDAISNIGVPRSMKPPPGGRWPANVALSHLPECAEGGCAEGCVVRALNEQAGERKSGARAAGVRKGVGYAGGSGDGGPAIEASSGSASRFFRVVRPEHRGFFYCPKASRAERELGCERLPLLDGEAGEGRVRNRHPTIKPVELMRWLARLALAPSWRGEPAGEALDPFAGSGTTGVALALEGFRGLLVEREAEYADVAEARVAAALAAAASGEVPRAWQCPRLDAICTVARPEPEQLALDLFSRAGDIEAALAPLEADPCAGPTEAELAAADEAARRLTAQPLSFTPEERREIAEGVLRALGHDSAAVAADPPEAVPAAAAAPAPSAEPAESRAAGPTLSTRSAATGFEVLRPDVAPSARVALGRALAGAGARPSPTGWLFADAAALSRGLRVAEALGYASAEVAA